MTADRTGPPTDLADLLAGAPPEAWGRTVLAVAAMHEPDRRGRSRHCRPDRRRWRRWRRDLIPPCPTRRMLFAETTTYPPEPQWTPA